MGVTQVRERVGLYHIIVQTFDLGLHCRRQPAELNAGARLFTLSDAPSIIKKKGREQRMYMCMWIYMYVT